MSSTPNVSLAVLRTLHRLHRQLADLRERDQRGPKQIRANEANIAHREQELAALRDNVKAMRVAADQKQLQLKAGEQKIKDHRLKLNAAASNREYQIFKEQIAADEMTNSVLEDEIIEALVKIDEFQAKVVAAEAALAAARQRARQLHEDVDRQQPLLEGDLRRLERELKECEPSLPPTVREVYMRVRSPEGRRRLGVRGRGRGREGRILQRLSHPGPVERPGGDPNVPSQFLQDLRPVALFARGIGIDAGAAVIKTSNNQ